MKQEVFNFLDSKKVPEDTKRKNELSLLKEYFNDFFQKYPQTNIPAIVNLSEKDIMLPLIILSNPYKLEEILNTLKRYPEIFKDNKCTLIFAGLVVYYSDEYLQELIERCASSNPLVYIPAAIAVGQILLDYGLTPDKADIISFFEEHPQGKNELKILFADLSTEYHNIASIFMDERDHYIYNGDKEHTNEKDFLAHLPREMKREYKKIFGTYKKDIDRFKEAINEYFGFISARYDEIIKAYEKSERERKAFNNTIEKLKKTLDTEEEIRDIDSILKLCLTNEIKEVVVNYIMEHNKKVYLKLIEQYEKAQQNSDENLTILFNNYGFNYLALTQEEKHKIKEMSYIDIEKLLKRLKALGLNIINISKVSSYKLSTIEELISKGIITKKWLQVNADLLYEDNNGLDIVVTSIDILSKEGINMLQYSNSLSITRSENLKHNLYLLRLYSLAITKNTTDINFLSANDLRLRIEFMYSLGIHSELTDLNILNYSIEEMLKLKIANSLNIPINAISDLRDLFCDFAPHLIPEALQEKLGMASDFIANIPMCLEKYRNDNQTLNINGIYVSTEKVKRNLAKIGDNSEESCFYAIIYNGYYTYEEIDILKESLIPEQSLLNGVRN